jgi:hypothetical protein
VVATTVAVPLAAASVVPADLVFDVAPLVEADAPYGSTAMRVSNTSTIDYDGPLTLTTPAWGTVESFAVTGATAVAVGSDRVWTIPAVSIPASQSVVFPLTWTGPFPLLAEAQPLTVAADASRGTVRGSGTVVSPYQLLWFAVTPGGDGDAAGTPSFFIGNTTETALASSTTAIRANLWSFPLTSSQPIVAGAARYPGARVADGGTIITRYVVPTPVPARVGKLLFAIEWSNRTAAAQQHQSIRSITTAAGVTLSALGSTMLHSAYAG